MAGDWIPMRIDLREDPAVMQMAEALGMNEICIVGHCHAIWSWLSRQCNDGSVTGVTLVSLGRVTQTGTFPQVMRDAGWIIEDEIDGVPVIRVPHFERWLSQSAKSRALATKRQQSRRHDSVTNVSRSERDKNVTREEKSTEENINKKRGVSPASPSPSSSRKSKFNPLEADRPFPGKPFEDAWASWCRHRVEICRPLKAEATRQLLQRLAEMGEQRAIEAIRHSVSNGWQGIREPDAPNGRRPATVLPDFSNF